MPSSSSGGLNNKPVVELRISRTPIYHFTSRSVSAVRRGPSRSKEQLPKTGPPEFQVPMSGFAIARRGGAEATAAGTAADREPGLAVKKIVGFLSGGGKILNLRPSGYEPLQSRPEHPTASVLVLQNLVLAGLICKRSPRPGSTLRHGETTSVGFLWDDIDRDRHTSSVGIAGG
jgi:hypothetical protein